MRLIAMLVAHAPQRDERGAEAAEYGVLVAGVILACIVGMELMLEAFRFAMDLAVDDMEERP